MKVLSLFDGMACGMLAMLGAEVEVDRYVAFEIDKYAVQTSSHNFPMIEHRGDVFAADFTEFQGFDWLVGGSPCTYWSIAQKNNRETEASGLGWELFSQYVRALREAKPMYFIYENNKSMAPAIRASITETFGFEPICINSALVSAQNRQRLYWVGKRNEDGSYSKVVVEQPTDRGILLKDILETGEDLLSQDKALRVTARISGSTPKHTVEKHIGTMVAEPTSVRCRGRVDEEGNTFGKYEAREDGKNGALTANAVGANIADPISRLESVRVGCMPSPDGTLKNAQGMRVHSVDAKAVSQTAQGGGLGAKTGLYAVPVASYSHPHGWNEGTFAYEKFPNLTTGSSTRQQNVLVEPLTEQNESITKEPQAFCNKVYEVKDGFITIKGKTYPIKLADGWYVIRKLTVRECMRLQTIPEWYVFPVSNSQAYKMLGNGWTVAVIMHLIKSALQGG